MAKNNDTGLKEKNNDNKAHEPRITRLESGLFASKEDVMDVRTNMATRDDVKQTENQLNVRMDRVENRIDKLEENTNKRIDKVEDDTKEIRKNMATKDDIKQTENRLDKRIDKLEENTNKRIDKLEENMVKKSDAKTYIYIIIVAIGFATVANDLNLFISILSWLRG